jgi:hypothetical protein
MVLYSITWVLIQEASNKHPEPGHTGEMPQLHSSVGTRKALQGSLGILTGASYCAEKGRRGLGPPERIRPKLAVCFPHVPLPNGVRKAPCLKGEDRVPSLVTAD